MVAQRESTGRDRLLAVAGLALVAWLWLGASVVGDAALTPERFLDGTLPLRTATATPPAHQPFDDVSAITQDRPRLHLFAQGLAAGRIDLWNPWTSCGTPLWAEQGGPFFPTHLPYYLWPTRGALHLSLLLRVFILGVGGFALARRFGVSAFAGFVSGVCLELSGASLSLVSFGSVPGLCLVPWCVLAGSWAAEGRVGTLSGAAILVGLAAHSGHPASVVLTALAFGCGWAGHVVTARRRLRARVVVGRLAFVGLVGAGLGAPRLLPAVEHLAGAGTYKTTENARNSWARDAEHSRNMAPVSVFSAGGLAELRVMLRGLWPWRVSGAQALMVFFLAAIGLASLHLPPALLALALGGLFLGTGAFGHEAYPEIPGATFLLARYPWVLVTVAISVAAGLGVDALARAGAAVRVVAGMAMVSVGAKWAYSERLAFLSAQAQEVAVEAATVSLMWAALVGLALIVLARRFPGRPAAFVGGAAAVGQSAVVFAGLGYFPPSERVDRPPRIVDDIANLAGGSWRMHAPNFYLLPPNVSGLYGIQDVRASAATTMDRFGRFGALVPGMKTAWTEHYTPRADLPHLDLMAVRYLVVEAQAHPNIVKNPRFKVVRYGLGTEDEVAIFERRTAVPRARMAFEMQVVKDVEEAQEALAAHLPRVAIPLAQTKLGLGVILEPAASGERPEPLPTGTESPVAKVELVPTPDPDEVVVKVRTNRVGYLVVADTYHRGWMAEIDGASTPVFPANLAFRAVRVPEGTHEVRFLFRPRSFQWGVGFFLISAGILVWRARRAWRRT